MKPKEVILDAFELNVPERVPAIIFGGGMWTIHNSGNTFMGLANDPEKYAKVVVSTAEKLQSDMVYVGSGYNNFLVAPLGGKIKIRSIGAPDLEAPIVNTLEDLEALDISSIEEDEVLNTIWDVTRMVGKEIGDKFLVTTTAWGPFTNAANIRGVEKLMIDIYKNPDFVKKVVNFSADLMTKFYEPIVEDGTLEAVSIADPTASGDLISKKQFVEFALPSLKKFIKDMENRGIKTFLHICGNTTDKLREIAETKASCFSLDHKVDLGLSKKEIGKEICIAGNVNPVAVLNNGTKEQVKKSCEKCIELAGEGGGYVLAPGCDIPPTVPLENIQALINTARDSKY